MPTYAYACTECEHRFDIVQSFSEDSLTQCPQCDGRLRKLFNAVGVVFKGSGFYRNDSRSPAKAAKGDGHDKSEAASTSSESSDSKSTDSKSTDSKGTDSKSTDSKGAPKQDTGKKDAKPEAKTA